jgi:6-phosphogluconolactonase/glucosamine-6-phosphate isomerase/deaminase
MSAAAATRIEELATGRKPILLCLAAGDTPRATYSQLAVTIARGRIDRELLSFVQLDEWDSMNRARPSTHPAVSFASPKRPPRSVASTSSRSARSSAASPSV